MPNNIIKVTMNLSNKDEDNVKIVKDSFHKHSNAAAVSEALAITAELINLKNKGNRLLICNKNGDHEYLEFTNM